MLDLVATARYKGNTYAKPLFLHPTYTNVQSSNSMARNSLSTTTEAPTKERTMLPTAYRNNITLYQTERLVAKAINKLLPAQ